jgi:hypothetical protein
MDIGALQSIASRNQAQTTVAPPPAFSSSAVVGVFHPEPIMKRLLLLAAAVSLAACGGESTSPRGPASITLSKSSITFTALGLTEVVSATVLDANGTPMPGEPVTWSVASSVVEVVPAGSSAQVKSVAKGSVELRASSGSLVSNPVSVTVDQVPAAITKIAGEGQSVPRATAVPVRPSVRITDAGGSPVPGVSVLFSDISGGNVIGASQLTDDQGTATVGAWTLGPTAGAAKLEVSVLADSPIAPITFEAVALDADLPSVAAIFQGGWQATIQGTAVPIAPSISLHYTTGQPVVGRSVVFQVTEGNGSISQTSVNTNASGIAQLPQWTLGAAAGLNSLKATVQGAAVTNAELTFMATGCTAGPSTGFAINVCFLTPVTDNQRTAFVNAAAKWQSIITGNLPSVPAQLGNPSCGSNPPSLNMTIDDLLIFARIETIDGPGGILGSAGPCYFRNESPNLPVIGAMRFDAADLPNLEAAGQFNDVILHEMGHVLGIGIRVTVNANPTLWSPFLVDPSFPGTGAGCATGALSLDTHFTGPAATAAFNTMMPGYGGARVPVANVSCSGSINSHWRESVLGSELMTPNLNSNVQNPLSILTVMSLQDIGYVVNAGAADVRTEGAIMAGPGSGTGDIHLGNDVLVGERHTIDSRGRVKRVW